MNMMLGINTTKVLNHLSLTLLIVIREKIILTIILTDSCTDSDSDEILVWFHLVLTIIGCITLVYD